MSEKHPDPCESCRCHVYRARWEIFLAWLDAQAHGLEWSCICSECARRAARRMRKLEQGGGES